MKPDRRSRRRPSAREIVTDLRAWCTERGVPVRVVSPATVRVRTPPTALGDVLGNYAERSVASVGERFLAPIPDARVWGDRGLVLLPDGTVAAESLYGTSHLDGDPAFRSRPPRRAPLVGGDTVLLSGEFSNRPNWFHWFHEGLLRLHGVLECVPDRARILVPTDLAPWKAATLHRLGIPEERLLRYDGRTGARFERLWYPSLPSTVAEHPGAVAWLRERLLAGEGAGTGRRERLFISRAGVTHARIVDEAALAPLLAARGFTPIRPETLTVTQQIRSFAGATHVVGPTGAGFTNLIFAAPTTRVLEILEPAWAGNKAFPVWSWAESLGQPFAYLVARTAPVPGRPDRADLAVDPEVFGAALDRWLDAPADPA